MIEGTQNQGQTQEDNTSTIAQPQGQDPIGAERPSQAEGERETVEDGLREKEGQDQG